MHYDQDEIGTAQNKFSFLKPYEQIVDATYHAELLSTSVNQAFAPSREGWCVMSETALELYKKAFSVQEQKSRASAHSDSGA